MPVEADKLEVINAALALIGDDFITSLSDSGEREDLANKLYEIRLEEALGLARWRFSTKQIQLTLNVTAPLARWDAAYDLPAVEPLAIHAVTVDGVPIGFDRYGTQIYCNAASTDEVYLDYSFRAEEADWTGRFKGAFVDQMAADFALSKDKELSEALARRSVAKFRAAASMEAQERSTRKLPTHGFTRARRTGYAPGQFGSAGAGTGSGGSGTLVVTVSDGDKGDIIVTSGVWEIDAGAVGSAELASLSVTEAKIALDAITLALMEHGNSGDILYYGAAGEPFRLAKGADNEVLTLVGGLPAWSAAGGVGDNSITLAKMEHGTSGDILYYGAAGAPMRLAKGTDGQVLTLASGLPAWASLLGAFGSQLLHVREEQASGTDGGTHTSGSYVTRVLNTVKTNEITGATLVANQISLPAGDYFIMARVPHYNTAGGYHKGKLENVTDTTDLVIGATVKFGSATDTTTDSWIVGRFTLALTKTLELTHRTSLTKTAVGLGGAGSFGEVEVYSEALIWKV